VNSKEPTLNISSGFGAEEVVTFLRAHPDFFTANPQLLAEIQVPHPQLGQAISLVERQAMILRERIKSMELKMAEMLRHGQENDAISNSIQQWLRGVLLHEGTADLPTFLAGSLAQVFQVPQVGIAIWKPATDFLGASWVTAADAAFVGQVDQMQLPACGPANVSAAAALLPDQEEAQSIAVLPLRMGAAPQAYGVLVLGSPDSQRFSAQLGTAFLERISELASAALARCAARSSG